MNDADTFREWYESHSPKTEIDASFVKRMAAFVYDIGGSPLRTRDRDLSIAFSFNDGSYATLTFATNSIKTGD